jgi:CoA:oxalate CoA-transferase
MVLADLGARVIKVEQPGTGDDSRSYGPFHNGASAYFASLNRGKESIALDLKAGHDRLIFDRLLATADVVVENYRPGTMEKLGLGWDALHARYPRLIYAAASGFGHTGPYSKRAAYDMVVQAMGGIMSVTGHPGHPPVRVGTSVGDITAGLFTAIGINSALFHRAATGEATKIDVAMLDCQVAILENAIARYAATGEIAGPIGARHPSITPFAGFEARDGWMVIAAGNDQLFGKLAAAIGRPDLASDPRYATNALRTEHWQPLFAEINATLRSRSTEEWLKELEGAGVPSGPINTIDKVLADPQVRARNMVVAADDPETGRLVMAGNPIKLSAFADPEVRKAAPKLDADRAAILAQIAARELLGEGVTFRAQALADALLAEPGDGARAVVVDLVRLIDASDSAALAQILELLARRYAPDPHRISEAADRWRADPSSDNLMALTQAVEPPRREIFRRMSTAPGGWAALLKLRAELLPSRASNPELAPVDADLHYLLRS